MRVEPVGAPSTAPSSKVETPLPNPRLRRGRRRGREPNAGDHWFLEADMRRLGRKSIPGRTTLPNGSDIPLD
jgi:hypothetical protein